MPLITDKKCPADLIEAYIRWFTLLYNSMGGSNFFRYYDNRDPVDVLKDHLFTMIFTDFRLGVPLAYAHLEKREDGRVWLGIAVLPSMQGKGLGTGIVTFLTEDITRMFHSGDVWLTVDNDNIAANKLYKKSGFELIEQRGDFKVMRKKVVDGGNRGLYEGKNRTKTVMELTEYLEDLGKRK